MPTASLTVGCGLDVVIFSGSVLEDLPDVSVTVKTYVRSPLVHAAELKFRLPSEIPLLLFVQHPVVELKVEYQKFE
jgi:hypothetical protein